MIAVSLENEGEFPITNLAIQNRAGEQNIIS